MKHNLLVGIIGGLIVAVIVALFSFIVTKPHIQLSAEPNPVAPGESVTVSWDVTDADVVELEGANPQPVIVAKNDRKLMRITQTTTIRIRAYVGWLKALGIGPEVKFSVLKRKSPLENYPSGLS